MPCECEGEREEPESVSPSSHDSFPAGDEMRNRFHPVSDTLRPGSSRRVMNCHPVKQVVVVFIMHKKSVSAREDRNAGFVNTFARIDSDFKADQYSPITSPSDMLPRNL